MVRASSPGRSRRPPAALLAVVVAVVLEALALLAVAVTYLVLLVTRGTVDVVFATLTAALAVALGVGLAACARGLLRHRRWARAPVLTWQLLQVATVVPAVGGPLGAGALALLVLAAVVVVGLFTPPVLRATGGTGSAPPVL